jgi:endonuclease/exonuclease/phosphatase family metal-dependent hydrolase
MSVAAVLIAACTTAHIGLGSEDELRVMTWNIQAGGKGLDSLAAVIQAEKPDIVGLQEVDVHWSERSGFADQARELATRLGMRAVFGPIYSLPGTNPGNPRREFGVAILTRHPVLKWQNHMLTRLSTQVAGATPTLMPGLLEADIGIRGRTVRVFTTHLDYRADPALRRQQVDEMLRYLALADAPTIVVGDLNAGPDAPELAPLRGVLRDAWRGGVGDSLTYPAEKPAKRIDYVLTTSHLVAVDERVLPSTASDHRAVIARLRYR